VGARLTQELLRRGHEVRGVDHPAADMRRVQLILKDINLVSLDLLQAGVEGWTRLLAGVDGCIHCAWEATPGKYLFAPENVQWLKATLDLYQAIPATSCKRLLGIGTCFEYDTSVGYLSENTPLTPGSLYAASKVAAYAVGSQLLARQGVQFAWARLFYLFGEEEAQGRLVPDVIQKLLRDQPVELTEGRQVRDFMYIGDAAKALADIFENPVCGAVNVGSGAPVTVRQLVETMASIIGKDGLLKFGVRQENACDPAVIVADISRLRDEVGFSRNDGFDVAMCRVVDWWRGKRN
jgi:nucleoside-diphosphate-sugar epimerase